LAASDAHQLRRQLFRCRRESQPPRPQLHRVGTGLQPGRWQPRESGLQPDAGQIQPVTGRDSVRTNGIEHAPSLAGNRGEAGLGLAAATGARALCVEFEYAEARRITHP
jgi:hypothetical protein